MGIYEKIFGNPSKKYIKRIAPIVKKINDLEKDFSAFSDEDLKKKTEEFKEKIKTRLSSFVDEETQDELNTKKDLDKEKRDRQNRKEKKVLDEILPEAFAVVREAAKRTIGQRHFDVQLMGGIALHEGNISEMRTGEGKTLVSTLPIYLNALLGKGVHVVTVNDYLARRDAQWMGKIYDFLGLKVGVIVHDFSYLVDFGQGHRSKQLGSGGQEEKGLVVEQQVEIEKEDLVEVGRRDAYSADITYGTNNEFGFDYLKDNMASDTIQKVQRDLQYAIVDEIDSILIDEARTPLIISAPAEESGDMYRKFAAIVPTLKENEDYNVDEKMRAVSLTDGGISKIENILGMSNIYDKGVELVHHIEQALKAQVLFQKDRDYVVKDGEIIIVDEFTGRLMFGRRYSEGLHQAIEAKEAVEIKRESMTLATITFQNYFRLYNKLGGMTGTAMTEEEEFFNIYKLSVIEIPTNNPMIRKDVADKIFKNEDGKFKALVEEIKDRYEKGQPVLVGTISIERNEVLSGLLKLQGVPHEVLNAKNHEREAAIIAQAGAKGAVMVATNMAGRGVDIVLGGHPFDIERAEEVKKLGGLCVFGSERHESRRIDNQLRGRAGRQGDPGFSQFFISMEDDLMRIFGADRIKRLMTTLGIPDDQPIENKMISRAIETAQKKVEGHNFDIRKHVLEYDDVMNRQRTAIYGKRNKVLVGRDEIEEKEVSLIEKTKEIFNVEIKNLIAFHTSKDRDGVDKKEIWENFITIVDKDTLDFKEEDLEQLGSRDIEEKFLNVIDKQFEERRESMNEEELTKLIRMIYLRIIDMFWINHLTEMDHLRAGIGLVGYGQKDPLVEYKHKSFSMFQQLLGLIDNNFVRTFFKIQIQKSQIPQNKSQENRKIEYKKEDVSGSEKQKSEQTVSARSREEIGRNDPCPCGSGKKYKRCCGANK